VFGNNPSFRVLSVDKAGDIVNYDEYALNLTQANMKHGAHWVSEYNFNRAYNMVEVSSRSLASLLSKLSTNQTVVGTGDSSYHQ
jgi:Acid sphingomyelin phosphodiesterase C-terminal region